MAACDVFPIFYFSRTHESKVVLRRGDCPRGFKRARQTNCDQVGEAQKFLAGKINSSHLGRQTGSLLLLLLLLLSIVAKGWLTCCFNFLSHHLFALYNVKLSPAGTFSNRNMASIRWRTWKIVCSEIFSLSFPRSCLYVFSPSWPMYWIWHRIKMHLTRNAKRPVLLTFQTRISRKVWFSSWSSQNFSLSLRNSILAGTSFKTVTSFGSSRYQKCVWKIS